MKAPRILAVPAVLLALMLIAGCGSSGKGYTPGPHQAATVSYGRFVSFSSRHTPDLKDCYAPFRSILTAIGTRGSLTVARYRPPAGFAAGNWSSNPEFFCSSGDMVVLQTEDFNKMPAEYRKEQAQVQWLQNHPVSHPRSFKIPDLIHSTDADVWYSANGSPWCDLQIGDTIQEIASSGGMSLVKYLPARGSDPGCSSGATFLMKTRYLGSRALGSLAPQFDSLQ